MCCRILRLAERSIPGSCEGSDSNAVIREHEVFHYPCTRSCIVEINSLYSMPAAVIHF